MTGLLTGFSSTFFFSFRIGFFFFLVGFFWLGVY
jgi:hypothetical protein